jgi:hypothetical protein
LVAIGLPQAVLTKDVESSDSSILSKLLYKLCNVSLIIAFGKVRKKDTEL